jgi:TPR repeat protein
MGFDNPVLPAAKIKIVNASKAREFLARAAEQGDVLAMSRLGLLLLRGNGVSELGDSVYDNAEAVKWLRAGAKGGSFEAQTLLGLAYFKMKLYSKAQQV